MNVDYALIKNIQKLLSEVRASGADDCLVAGGAVRDMLLDKPIKDIDVFYTGELGDLESVDTPVEEEQKEKEKEKVPYPIDVGWEVTGNIKRPYLEYPVQLIKVTLGTIEEHVADTFGVGLSKVMIDQGGLIMLNDFLQDSFLEDLTFQFGCSKEYMEKIQAKYPNYSASYDPVGKGLFDF